jgi:N-acetylmuramic acid 6-phosphate etherase
MPKQIHFLLSKSLFFGVAFFYLSTSFAHLPEMSQGKQSSVDSENYYLNLLKITQSDQSKDYVNNKKQFQLHTLITEQSHPATINLTDMAKNNPRQALNELITVDHDIAHKIATLETDKKTMANIQQAVAAVKNSILQGNKVYIYGTGSTGRLAKQIENIWQTFWRDTKSRQDWPQIAKQINDIPHLNNIQNLVIGEITGRDRALIKSLEGFEDLQLIGKLQLDDNKIDAKDVVFAVTEGGETSAVIGTILSASKSSGSKPTHLYFVYNNPDELLMPFDRSREVLENSNITKINFTTGKQAITGSTRMQATSSQTFLIAAVIEQALAEILRDRLSISRFQALGFDPTLTDVLSRLKRFNQLQRDVEKQKAAVLDIADVEYQAYLRSGHAIYFGSQFLTTLFIDVTERAPTFNLAALDPVDARGLSWIDIYTNAHNLDQAWQALLFRDFRGLDKEKYASAFKEGITDPYLKSLALKSLNQATDAQKFLYDFSINRLAASQYTDHDIAIAYLLVDEVKPLLATNQSPFREWLAKLSQQKVKINVVLVGLQTQQKTLTEAADNLKKIYPETQIKQLVLHSKFDPLQVQRKVALKLFLNLQSTLIMARLERVLGNSMIFVYPSNLKLTGRATYLSELHVNRILASKPRFSDAPSIDYNQANAILFDASQYIEDHQLRDQVSIIPLVMVRIFEGLQNKPASWKIAQKILSEETLGKYIDSL